MKESNLGHLREALLSILEVKKTRSQTWLAKQTGVAQKTLNRFLREEVQTISLKGILALAKFCLADTNKGILSQAQKSALKEVMRIGEGSSEVVADNLNEKIQRFLTENSDWCLLVYLLSCNKFGVSQKTLFALGEEARAELDKLLAKKWIKEEEQSYHAINKNFSITKKVLLQRISRIFVERAHPDWWNEKGKLSNFLYLYSEGLNEKAMQKVTSILSEASKQIEEVITDKDSLGKLPVSILLLNDCLTS